MEAIETDKRVGAACVASALAVVSLAPLFVRGEGSQVSATWHYVGRAAQILACLALVAIARGHACPRPWTLQLVGSALCLASGAIGAAAGALAAPVGVAAAPATIIWLFDSCLNGTGAALALVGTLLWLPCLGLKRAAVLTPLALAAAHALFLASLALPTPDVRAARAACYAAASVLSLASRSRLGPVFLAWRDRCGPADQTVGGSDLRGLSGEAEGAHGALSEGMAGNAPVVVMGAAAFPFFYGQLAQLSHPATGLFDPVSEAVAVAALLLYASFGLRRRNAANMQALLPTLVAVFATGYLLFPLASGSPSAPPGWMVKAGFLICSCAVWSWASDAAALRPEAALGLFAGVEACLHAAIMLGRALVAGLVSSGWSQDIIASRLVPVAIWALAMLLLAVLWSSQRRTARPGGALAGERPAASASGPAGASDKGELEAACERLSAENGLTAREAEVLGEFARGRSSSYIANEMGLSQQTVKTHLKHVYQKVGVHSKQDLLDMLEAAETEDEEKSGRAEPVRAAARETPSRRAEKNRSC